MYCVYLTVYKGNMLPRRYIGSSNVKKILDGYNGSISSRKWSEIYKEEQINNKHLFKTRILSIHLCRKEALEKELEIQIKYNVVNSMLYMNEALAKPNGSHGRDVSGENNPMYGSTRKGEKHAGSENISKALKAFYSTVKGKESKEKATKKRIDNESNIGRKASDETKKRMSDAKKGAKNIMFGKTHSDDARLKISLSKIGKPAHNKGKKMSDDQKMKMKKREPLTEDQKVNYRKTYIVNGEIIKNAKEYCANNGLNYPKFTSCAKHGKLYNDLKIEYYDKE